MKVLDASSFYDGLGRNLNLLTRLETEMKTIETAIQGLTQLEESLKGQGGNAIRAFYTDCHLPFLQFFYLFKNSFHDVLTQMEAALDTLEPDATGYIHQGYLEGEVEQGLSNAKDVTETLTSETNSIMREVSDIVPLPNLDDSEVQSEIQAAKLHRDTTIDDLIAFDSSQTSALSIVESDLIAMNAWIRDLETMITEGLTDVNFPAEHWAQYASTTALQTALTSRTNEMDDVTGESREETTGDVTSADETVLEHKQDVANMKRFSTAVNGAVESFGLFMAGKNAGLKMELVRDTKTGRNVYRLVASEKALQYLRVTPDAIAQRQLNYKLPKGNKPWKPKHHQQQANNRAILKYGTRKPGTSGWSTVGEAALKDHSSLAYWNDKATITEKAKTVGKATLSGTGKAFKDIVDVKGIFTNGYAKGFTKALGPVSAGLNYYSNYHNAVDDGVTGAKAHARATVDTAIDTAVGGAVQAASVALFTAAVPIPGVGTAIGIGVGLFVNGMLNKKNKKTGKSAMDKIKGWFH
ncbi:transposase [Ureibacillus massiliensis 4400831 = CIP 108448 = CCUG 49529]|uniref:Transposase n=1 Tax=Ureibacillus massiliensis 4400831 = CIP 108448 = CCUG 49529 TaxID=1211035 RepID=A0A0A3J580_9BACL|nr:LXG domain-containing protein [Ureibacillus massiliensis]KGR90860.1 transposase [Ureibacillus massiliensis 4400831 = CIP 108448 = CCUG 49529]